MLHVTDQTRTPDAAASSGLTEIPSQNATVKGFVVNVYCNHGHDDAEVDYQREPATLILTSDDNDVRISWRAASGKLLSATTTKRQFCLVPPGLKHTCRWKRGAECIVLLLEDEFLREHVAEPVSDVLVGDFGLLSRMDGLLWSLTGELRRVIRRRDEWNPFFVASLGAVLASRTLEHHFRPREAKHQRRSELAPVALKKVMDHVESHLGERLSLEELARQVHLSTHHFAKLFKGAMGVSPIQYVLRQRVERALELLRTGNFRVAEVATEVGFFDQSHLDRHCRKFFGASPRTLLKRNSS